MSEVVYRSPNQAVMIYRAENGKFVLRATINLWRTYRNARLPVECSTAYEFDSEQDARDALVDFHTDGAT